MKLHAYETILSEPLAFWAASSNKQNIPDVVRCIGLAPLEDYNNITFYIPGKYSEGFMSNLFHNSQITFMGCALLSFESYQYKGIFKAIRSCTEEEAERQRQYLEAFTDLIQEIGYSKEGFYNAYFHQPSFAITFEVQEIFEQTPKKGTGNLLEKKQELHE